MVFAYETHILGKVVASLVEGLLEPVEQVLPILRDADEHGVRRVEMQGNLVSELRHLDVDTGVNLAAEVRAQHFLVRRILAVLYPERLGVVLALHARGAQRTRKQTDLHAAPGSGVAWLVRIALVRPEVESQHPDGRTRKKHVRTPRGVELETADEVEASTLDVLDALVKTAVYVVEIPAR